MKQTSKMVPPISHPLQDGEGRKALTFSTSAPLLIVKEHYHLHFNGEGTKVLSLLG